MKITHKALRGLDKVISIKNGYLFFAHIVPFAAAALLLLILSLPPQNLLSQLAGVLETPKPIWIPAIILTTVATIVYFATILEEVRHVYLWSKWDFLRSFSNSVVYLSLTTWMAISVLQASPTFVLTREDIWASYLVAVLSLTGIGWKTPGSWVKSVGIVPPDYKAGRQAVSHMTELLNEVRRKVRGEKGDIKEMSEVVESLMGNLKKNLDYEPTWNELEIEETYNLLEILKNEIDKRFLEGDYAAVEDFASACKFQERMLYTEFVETLEKLGEIWPDWSIPES